MSIFARITLAYSLSLVLWIHISSSDAYILRLSCTYQANFSVQHLNKYLVSSNPTKLYLISAKDCLFHCVQELKCTSINHRTDNSECELLTVAETQLESRVGWKYYATEQDELLIGEACKTLKPCGSTKQCKETCVAPYYKCITIPNISEKKKVSAGSNTVFESDKPSYKCVDGGLSSACSTKKKNDQKWKIVLGKSYQIIYIVITINTNFKSEINNYGIYIGNSNVPKKNAKFAVISQDTVTKRYDHKTKVFIGKYVWLQRTVIKQIPLTLREIRVYGIKPELLIN